jgi:hypothetical protein
LPRPTTSGHPNLAFRISDKHRSVVAHHQVASRPAQPRPIIRVHLWFQIRLSVCPPHAARLSRFRLSRRPCATPMHRRTASLRRRWKAEM